MDEPSTILVVDEDPSIRDVLVQKLEALGYRTLEARNGREALDTVALEPPDLIMLDVMMPVMDGFQACRLLKDDEDTRLIPIIIMTALHAVEDRIRGAEVGADVVRPSAKRVPSRVAALRAPNCLMKRVDFGTDDERRNAGAQESADPMAKSRRWAALAPPPAECAMALRDVDGEAIYGCGAASQLIIGRIRCSRLTVHSRTAIRRINDHAVAYRPCAAVCPHRPGRDGFRLAV